MESIELRGGFLEVFNAEIVENTLTKIENIIDESCLLNNENFHLKMRLFLKLKEELDALHTLPQSSNYFSIGSWHYKGESLSRKA